MISIPLRMSNVMKRKLKKCANRIHNGNPSCRVSSITRNSRHSIWRVRRGRSLTIASALQKGWRNVHRRQYPLRKTPRTRSFRSISLSASRYPIRRIREIPGSNAKRKCRMSILKSSSGIVDVQQQRLNCALPSFSLKLWFLSIPKASRHIRG